MRKEKEVTTTKPQSTTEPTPPLTMVIRWCPVCGRDDRVSSFKNAHYSRGELCRGKPITVEYVCQHSSSTAPVVEHPFIPPAGAMCIICGLSSLAHGGYSPASAAPVVDCRWCRRGDVPKFLDQDGTNCAISHEPGTLCHAHEEYWWPCLRFGRELRWPVDNAVLSSKALQKAVTQAFKIIDKACEVAAVADPRDYVCTRSFPCRYKDARQCARDAMFGSECPKVCECECHAAAATTAPVEQESQYVVIDGERRRAIPCPDGKPDCEVLHTEPVTDDEGAR